MKYYALLNQTGGCDYTHRCGLDIKEIPNATSMDEAISMWEDMMFSEDYYYKGEFALSEITILEVNDQTELNVELLYHRESIKEAERKRTKTQNKEYLEYLKLKEKYEK